MMAVMGNDVKDVGMFSMKPPLVPAFSAKKGEGWVLVAAGGSYCACPGAYGHHSAVYVYV